MYLDGVDAGRVCSAEQEYSLGSRRPKLSTIERGHQIEE